MRKKEGQREGQLFQTQQQKGTTFFACNTKGL